jgi:hypothetical protein
VEIEFLDPDERSELPVAAVETIGPDTPERPRRFAGLEIGWDVAATALLFGGAAALLFVAPFQAVFTEAARAGNVTSGSAVDGWGRYTTIGQASVLPGVHDARYGIPLTCGAAGCAVLAALLVVATLRRHTPRTARPLAVAGLVLAALLAGITGTMWLHIQALFDTIHATTNGTANFSVDLGGFHVGVGAAPWLATAAVVAVLLGALGCLRLRAADNVTTPA